MPYLVIPSWRNRLVVGIPAGCVGQVNLQFNSSGQPILPGDFDMLTEAGIQMETENNLIMEVEH